MSNQYAHIESTSPIDHDLQSNELFFDDFEGDDLVFFTDNSGIAINLSNGRVLLFQSTLGHWAEEEYLLSDIRNAHENAPVADHHYAMGNLQGSQGVGLGLGIAIKNASAQKKANQESGIIIDLKSTALPSFLIHVEDTSTRRSLMEALRQVLRDGDLRVPFRRIPLSVSQAYHRPTETEIATEEARDQKRLNRKKATRLQLKDFLALPVLALLGLILIWQVYGDTLNPNGHSDEIFGVSIILFIGLLPVAYVMIKMWKLAKYKLMPKR
ncbi:MAG: hypothetical protein ABJO57_10095 [Lentilitoribacter sp.]